MAPPAEAAVVVVGAGLAGLRAASALEAALGPGGGRVVVVEAGAGVGGRVCDLRGVAPGPVQLGAEFLHGKDHSLLFDQLEVRTPARPSLAPRRPARPTPVRRAPAPRPRPAPPPSRPPGAAELTPAPGASPGGAQAWGWELREREWPNYYWWGGRERRLLGPEGDARLDRVHALFEGLWGEVRLPDMSCLEWLRAQGCSPDEVAAAETCYANDFGCSLRELGTGEMIQEVRNWVYGPLYLISTGRSLADAPRRMAEGLRERVHCGWPVRRVQYGEGRGGGGAGGCVVHGPGGESVRCGAVVVTVPVSVLRDGDIAFEPPLPPAKALAARRIQMGTASKVVLVFSEPFWPEDFFDVCCMHEFIAEFWVAQCPPPRPGEEAGAAGAVLVGFQAGDGARAMERLPDAEVARRACAQLDRIFGPGAPATARLRRHAVKHWGTEPFIKGAYSFPAAGVGPLDRRELAAPVAGALFFAGEATHIGVNPCMQAALETGERAAREVAQSLVAQRPSRL